ncbi:MAG: hypothetical protein ACI4QM_03190 [Alphaproteobacteria bacterium]
MKKGIRYTAAAALLVFVGYGVYTATEWATQPAPVPEKQTPVAHEIPKASAAVNLTAATPSETSSQEAEDNSVAEAWADDDFWKTSHLIPNSDVDVNTLTTTQKLAEAFPGFYIYYLPQIYIKQFPDDFAVQGTPNLFVKVMLPLIAHENNLIKKDRTFLEGLYQKMADNTPWDESETARFNTLVQTYGLTAQKIPATQIEELLMRVDIIPPSLAIAVTGIQTNWGKESLNAPFGQKEWENGRYVDKTFPVLDEAVHAFMLELNSLAPYQNLRVNRRSYKNLRGSLGARLVNQMAVYNPQDTGYEQRLSEAFKTMALPVLDQAALFE